MLSYSPRTNSVPRPRLDDKVSFDRRIPAGSRTATSRFIDQYSRLNEERSRHLSPSLLLDFPTRDGIGPAVDILPSNAVKRRALAWDGMAIEVMQALTHETVEFRFRASRHLLVVYEEGVRNNGETLIDGLSGSTLRDVKRKLAFVPAGHEYRDWHEPRTRSRIVFFYFDPAKMPVAAGAGQAALAPRLFFEDAVLWDTAVKLAKLIESGSEDQHYCEALGVVLAHDLVHRNIGARRNEPPARGGLAAWQERTVSAYIEEHMAEQIPLSALARLVRLSPYHFCRAFKQSFGMPPHRYHNARRIKYARTLLAQPSSSVTEIALKVGFSETSSFTASFRKATGSTPTAYRRALG